MQKQQIKVTKIMGSTLCKSKQIDDIYNEFYSHLPSLGAEFDVVGQELYYFWDDEKQKVRYIFLDGNDIPYSVDKKGKFKYTKQHLFALSQRQINWLCDKALAPPEEGWDMVITAHAFPRWCQGEGQGDGELRYLEVLGDIIDAYRSGRDLKRTYFENEFEVCVCADFSKYKRGNILACFAGHHHADFEERSQTGVPIIYTGNVIMYQYKVPRIDGDKTELLFDVVTIDKDKKVIYTTRIGAGQDREILL